MTRPAEGAPAPAFTLATDTGETVSLADFAGRTVVLYFYPKDDTPGCTTESCQFRDLFPRFARDKAVILGISPDSVKSHAKFKKKYDLPFTLLADEGHAVADAYGVWALKTFMGRKYMGVERTTFIIGPDGRVARVFEKVKPDGHADEVMVALRDLAK
ncbi:MAG TPA: thioredoxin-dependent thiol peroxidase [Gemmatimonadaceae bacterium]|nr:thioredoxin-dependent thiol peroxidase [Gemmatimonadaceae bacterium]